MGGETRSDDLNSLEITDPEGASSPSKSAQPYTTPYTEDGDENADNLGPMIRSQTPSLPDENNTISDEEGGDDGSTVFSGIEDTGMHAPMLREIHHSTMLHDYGSHVTQQGTAVSQTRVYGEDGKSGSQSSLSGPSHLPPPSRLYEQHLHDYSSSTVMDIHPRQSGLGVPQADVRRDVDAAMKDVQYQDDDEDNARRGSAAPSPMRRPSEPAGMDALPQSVMAAAAAAAGAGGEGNTEDTCYYLNSESLLDEFQRYSFTMEAQDGSDVSKETQHVCHALCEFIRLRHAYLDEDDHITPKAEATPLPQDAGAAPTPHYNPFEKEMIPRSNHIYQMVDGVMRVYASKRDFLEQRQCVEVLPFLTFYGHCKALSALSANAAAKSLAFRRLKLLEAKFDLHMLLNEGREIAEQKGAPHRDFYNVRKVDTHVHLSSCMNQKHLLRFIKKKLREEGELAVIEINGQKKTLQDVFQMLNLTPYHLSVDTLDVHADRSTFHRFDKFNLKYNPCGQSELRDIFLKTDNYLKGRFFGHLCKEVFEDLEESKYQMAEYRVSIYGRSPEEWEALATWVNEYKLYSDNVRWLIQVPRLYQVHKATGKVKNFQEMLRNIFGPLFEVTCDPTLYPNMYVFLQHVVGFDSVDDESKGENRFHSRMPNPAQWDGDENPPYSYYMYYMYANIKVLNQLRRQRGLNTFAFRPHSGEAGDESHLAATFLLSRNISHGILLRKALVLQYLYYLCQIPLALSPLSNNGLFLKYNRNPFPDFFSRGLVVTLSTDDPLMFHFTKEPLIEEYSIAAQVYDLSNADLCEIAANSVRMSGFEHSVKSYWLGKHYELCGERGNDMDHTNIPAARMSFRKRTWQEENMFIIACGSHKAGTNTFDEIRKMRMDSAFDTDKFIRESLYVFDSDAVVHEMRRVEESQALRRSGGGLPPKRPVADKVLGFPLPLPLTMHATRSSHPSSHPSGHPSGHPSSHPSAGRVSPTHPPVSSAALVMQMRRDSEAEIRRAMERREVEEAPPATGARVTGTTVTVPAAAEEHTMRQDRWKQAHARTIDTRPANLIADISRRVWNSLSEHSSDLVLVAASATVAFVMGKWMQQ